jgi:hypothetical protein
LRHPLTKRFGHIDMSVLPSRYRIGAVLRSFVCPTSLLDDRTGTARHNNGEYMIDADLLSYNSAISQSSANNRDLAGSDAADALPSRTASLSLSDDNYRKSIPTRPANVDCDTFKTTQRISQDREGARLVLVESIAQPTQRWVIKLYDPKEFPIPYQLRRGAPRPVYQAVDDFNREGGVHKRLADYKQDRIRKGMHPGANAFPHLYDFIGVKLEGSNGDLIVPAIIMEHVPGTRMADIDSKILATGQNLVMMEAVVRAYAFILTAGVMCNELYPSLSMVRDEATVKPDITIVDFGNAQVLQTTPCDTVTDMGPDDLLRPDVVLDAHHLGSFCEKGWFRTLRLRGGRSVRVNDVLDWIEQTCDEEPAYVALRKKEIELEEETQCT